MISHVTRGDDAAMATEEEKQLSRGNEKPKSPAKGPLVISINVYSDVLCPWCYVEKRSLEAAMDQFREKHPETKFEVIWKPFYLNPLLKTRCNKRSLYDEWSGGPDRFDRHISRFQAAGSKYSIDFSFAGQTGSSRASHRLVALTLARAGPAAQDRVVEALFRGQFQEGRDISDEAWLIEVGRDAGGVPAELVARDLDDDDQGRRVDEECEAVREDRGVEAVPCVTVQERYKVGGYQEPHVFVALFEKIWAQRAG